DNGFECNIGRRIEYRSHAEVYGSFPQLLHALMSCDVVQYESDSRMRRGKPLNRSRQHVVDGRLSGGDRESPLLDVVPAIFKVPIQGDQSFDQGPGKLVKQFALVS